MIELAKQYKTRNGRQARVYATDGGGVYSVHGAWFCEHTGWCPAYWTEAGKTLVDCNEHDRDLIEVKPRIVLARWVNMYRVNGELRGHHHHSQAAADSAAGDGTAGVGRIACVKIVIDCEEGEGLLNGRSSIDTRGTSRARRPH